jgi:hypothetical protein
MDISFIPYNFNTNLSTYRKELLLIGVTYYERLLVFEHLKKSVDQILGLNVDTIELSFDSEALVSVTIVLKERDLRVIKIAFEKKLNQTLKKNEEEELVRPNKNLLYHYQDEKYFIGIVFDFITTNYFIYVTLIQFNIYYLDERIGI